LLRGALFEHCSVQDDELCLDILHEAPDPTPRGARKPLWLCVMRFQALPLLGADEAAVLAASMLALRAAPPRLWTLRLAHLIGKRRAMLAAELATSRQLAAAVAAELAAQGEELRRARASGWRRHVALARAREREAAAMGQMEARARYLAHMHVKLRRGERAVAALLAPRPLRRPLSLLLRGRDPRMQMQGRQRVVRTLGINADAAL
jgi:hypothetical protein